MCGINGYQGIFTADLIDKMNQSIIHRGPDFRMVRGEDVFINGDGETSRDFCFIENAVQANILAALAADSAKNEVYNVAVGDRTTLNELFAALRDPLCQPSCPVGDLA